MVKKLITMLLLLLLSTQLSWPATHLVSAHAPKDAAMVAGHNHSMGRGHDCCPQVATRFEIQEPNSGPCDDQHRCCMASREVPVVQASSSGVGPDFEGVNSCVKQSTPRLRSSPKLSDAVGPQRYQALIMVLRI